MTKHNKTKKPSKPLKFALIALAVATTIGNSPLAHAIENAEQSTEIVDIQAQSLAKALIAVSDVFDVTVLVDEALVKGKLSPPVRGNYTIEETLAALLNDSGLIAEERKTGAIAILASPLNMSKQETQVNDTFSTNSDVEIIKVKGQFQQSLIDRIHIDVDELPFSLNVLDRSYIDLRGFTAPFDTVSLAPNIDLDWDVFGLGFEGAVIRGYRGNVLINNRLQNDGGPRDDAFVERYEILKGPASIALGPTLPGGIINSVLKRPTDEPFTAFELSTDQFGTIDTEFDVNAGTLGKNRSARARISGSYRDFQFDADEEGRRSLAIRPVIEFNLSDKTSIQASAAILSAETRPNDGFALFSDGSIPEGFDTSVIFGIEGGETDVDDTFFEGQITHDFLDNLKLTVRGSYQDTSLTEDNSRGFNNYRYDDGSPGVGLNNPTFVAYAFISDNDNENKFFDAQLAGNFDYWDERQDFVIGVSYNELVRESMGTSFQTITDISIEDILAGPIPASLVDRANPDIFFNNRIQELTSVYAEFAVRPFNWLSIIGGIRYDDIKTESSINNLAQDPFSNNNLTFRIGANAEVFRNVRAYISVAESFVPQTGFIFGGGEASPSQGISYEAGLKGDLFDGVVAFETAVFETTRKDIAVFDAQNSVPNGPQFVTLIGEQRNRGFELTADIMPYDGLFLNMSYGHLDIDVISAAEFIGGETAPADNTFNAFITYEVQSGPMQGLAFGAGPRYVGDRQSPQQPNFAYPSYWLGDAVIRYPISDELQVQLNVVNMTDKLYLKNAGAGFGLLTGSNSFGEPRTFRLTLRGTF
ncbi:MAG: TonB-dependent receptor [Pseudomonadota bacterium]